MDNGEGLESSGTHCSGHTQVRLLRDNALYLPFVMMILSRMDQTGGVDVVVVVRGFLENFRSPYVFMNHRKVKCNSFGCVKNKTKVKERINQLSLLLTQ